MPSPDPVIAEWLVSAAGGELLRMVADLPGDSPTQLLTLRKRGIDGARAAGAVEVAAARIRARKRFLEAKTLYFTSDALAQATSPTLAAYHAARLQGAETVADLGCGVGMDAIAFARAGLRVRAFDTDPARLIFARANAAACGVSGQITFEQRDVTDLEWEADALYWDPSRRQGGTEPMGHRVSRHADRYEPPLSFLTPFRERVRRGVVKLSPALPDALLDSLNCRREFLGERGECKECCLLFGAGEDSSAVSAVLLPEGITIPRSAPAPVATNLGAFVLDPDAALIRADALGAAAQTLSAALISADDSYLTTNILPTDILPGAGRLASVYLVRAAIPYRARPVSEWLTAQQVGRLVVKKRHFPREPDAVTRELGLRGGGREMTLILVRTSKSHLAVLCEPVAGAPTVDESVEILVE